MFSLFSKRGWDDPDWTVRQRAALTLKNTAQLCRLALQDEVEVVRLAAAGRIEDTSTLLEVAKKSTCPATVRLAMSRIADPELRLALALDARQTDELRVLALEGLRADSRLLPAYRPNAPEPFRLALLEAVSAVLDDVFWSTVARSDPDLKAREKAISHIQSERICLNILRMETDPEARRALADGIRSDELLYQLLEIETKESQRIWLASRIQNPAVLNRIVRQDANHHVRLAAILRLDQVPMLVDLAGADLPRAVALAALARLHDDRSRAAVAMRSPHEDVRAEALRPITDEETLNRLEEEAPYPEIRWLAGRRVGSMPMKALAEIRNGPTLRRLIEQETEPEVATWLVGRIGDQETLRVLGGSTFPGVAAARRRLTERTGPLGIRFLGVPGRPYELSIFPITVGQVREALGSAVAGKGADDLPAAGLTPEDAERFCELLSEQGDGAYRLPSFEEWRHACMAGDENWLDVATGQYSWAEALLGTQRMAVGSKGRRSALSAWPNPWGFLDMIGNVAVWVDESARPWLPLAGDDPLAVGGDALNDRHFAPAAGVCWADPRVRKERLERLVARAALPDWAADKVGFRVLCEPAQNPNPPLRYKLVLLPEPAPGVTKEYIATAIGAQWPEAVGKVAMWYRLAPTPILVNAEYAEVRRIKRLLENSGARTRLTLTGEESAEA